MSNDRSSMKLWTPVVYLAGPIPAALIAFGVYWITLARHGDLGNGPELATAVSQFGVPHPSGFPLYMLGAGVFVRVIPFGSMIFKTALFSAATAAVAVAFVHMAAFSLLRRRWAAMLVALLFAFSDAVWSSATVTEVHALHLMLSAGMLAALLRGIRSGDAGVRQRSLNWAALCFGLSLTNHLLTLTWLPVMIIGMSMLRDRGRGWTGLRVPVMTAVVPLALYAYLPIAASRDPMMNWGDVRSWGHFVEHVSARSVWSLIGAPTWSDRLHALVEYGGWPEEDVRAGYLLSQFSVAILWLAPLGIVVMARRCRSRLVLLGVAYSVPVVWTIGAGIEDPGSHYATSHMIVALWIGTGARYVGHLAALAARRLLQERRGRRRLRGLVEVGALALPAMAMAGNFRVNDLSAVRTMEPLGQAIIERPARDAVLILSGRQWAFPACYAQQVERRRTDVVLLLEPWFRDPNFRLIRREQRRGITVREPECHHRPDDVANVAHGWCRIHQVIWDNYARRRVYVVGPAAEMLAREEAITSKLPRFRRIVPSLPMVEFIPPEPGVEPPVAAAPPVLDVVRVRRTGTGDGHGHGHGHEHKH